MTTEQIADRIRFAYRVQPVVAYRELGANLTLAGFLPFQEEVEYFGAKVLPLVRELGARRPAGVGH